MTAAAPHPPACAVVVTYHPDPGFPGRLARVVAEVGAAVVVDNRSNPAARAMIHRVAAADPRVRLIEHPDNLGVATGLNTGVRAAAAAGFRWVVTFDQDTDPHPGLVDGLFATRAAHPSAARVGLVGPLPVRPDGSPLFKPARGAYRPVSFVITSGTLLSVDMFDDIGPFRDDFFVDSVDREYGYRARAAGYRVLLGSRPGITHQLGDPTWLRVGPLKLAVSHHSPVRRYYITRNWLVVLARYLLREPGACGYEIALLVSDTGKAVLAERDRWRKLAAILRGAWDACRGRMGRTHPNGLEGPATGE